MNAVVDRPLLYSARPSIVLAGQARPELSAAVTSLTVRESVEGLYRLEATFGNWGTHQGEVGFLYFDRALFDFGAEIAVEMGAGQAEGRIFAGRITGLEGRFPGQRPPEITVLAEDKLQDLRMTRRTRSFEQASTADIVNRVAGDHGLQAQVDVDSISYAVAAQVNQSDLAFLRELARAADAELWIENGALHAQARSRRRAGPVTLVYGQTLQEFAVLADLAQQRTALTVSGWDVAGKTAIDEQATDSSVQNELDGGRSGAALLQEKFGARTEQIAHQMPLSSGEARACADAGFRRQARRFVTGRGVAEGDARIRVGAKVTLGELGPLFNGAYYVSAVRHAFDARGYRTSFTVERPAVETR
jgi:phage protein D